MCEVMMMIQFMITIKTMPPIIRHQNKVNVKQSNNS